MFAANFEQCPTYLTLSNANELIRIPAESLVYVASEGNYSDIYTRNGEKRTVTIQLGMAESTPLLEEATEKEGYFFRQYPLVLEGKMVENKPKNKALRHALCEWNGSIVTVSSMEKESLHDFAQALADLGVQNAIYLVGADSYGFCRTQSEGKPQTTTWGEHQTGKIFEKVNFIVWRINEM